MNNKFKSNAFVQPRFGILRPIGDMNKKKKEEIKSNLSEHDQKILALKDLWKLDEHIHKEATFNEISEAELKKTTKEFQAEYAQNLKEFNDKKIQKQKKFKKQGYNCYFCGFHDKKFLEIHHLNGDHSDNSDSNTVGACTLCHRQHHLLWLSLHNHASLGIFPENSITQTELNHLQRIAIVMQYHHDPEIRGRFGLTGKLGIAINEAVTNFSRPTPYHLVSIDDKEKYFLSRYPNYKNFDYTNPPNIDPNIADEAREKLIKEAQEKYDEHKAMAVNEQRQEIKESTNFSVYELAFALESLSWADYESFNPIHLRLCFNKTIFSKEQIEYYLSQPEFDPSKWQYLNKDFNQDLKVETKA